MGKSKIRRRSGTALVGYCELCDWMPDSVIQVGVGCSHQEVDAMYETWGDNVHFYGIEAHPGIADEAKKDYPGAIWNYAVVGPDDPASMPFYTKSKHRDGSSLFKHNKENPKNKYDEIQVETITLDRLYEQKLINGFDSLLWMDCEGGELKALLGAEQLIKYISMVNVEMTGVSQGDGCCTPSEVHAWLHDHGFARAWCHTTRSRFGQYDAIYVRREMLKPELAMCPCELSDSCELSELRLENEKLRKALEEIK